MSRLFGTDGVRGLVNEFLTPELAYHLGRAAASYFGQSMERPTFLIGRDTRISGGMLENALASGICADGGDVIILGEAPTPAIAYLVRQKGCTAGVVISASHNPYPDNGIKFFDGNGFKLPDAVEDEIEKLLAGTKIVFKAKSKKGNEMTVAGGLEQQTYKGKLFWGFKAEFDNKK